MKKILSEEDRSMLNYYWNEKGDLERWDEFENIKALIPDIVETWNEYKRKERLLTLLINDL